MVVATADHIVTVDPAPEDQAVAQVVAVELGLQVLPVKVTAVVILLAAPLITLVLAAAALAVMADQLEIFLIIRVVVATALHLTLRDLVYFMAAAAAGVLDMLLTEITALAGSVVVAKVLKIVQLHNLVLTA